MGIRYKNTSYGLNTIANNGIIRTVILSQDNFHLLPRNEKGICVYEGELDIRHSNIFKIPNNLNVTGKFRCEDNHISELPSKLTVGGMLLLGGNQLTRLPYDLVARYGVSVRNNRMTHLIKGDDIGQIFMDKEQRILYNRMIKVEKIIEKIKKLRR